jgi:acetylornithine deacetylase/succinyl-diaminopimelate desuccinylase-like protein
MLPDENPKNVLSALKGAVADTHVTVTQLGEPFLSPISPVRKDLFAAVERLADSMWPGVVMTPVMSTGASDGKRLRAEGIPVYGVSGMFSDIDDVRAHGRDERIGVRDFYAGVEFMYRFIRSFFSPS